jgi:hypothetical protein
MKFWFAVVITTVAVVGASCDSPTNKPASPAVAYLPDDLNAAPPVARAAAPATQPVIMAAATPTTGPAEGPTTSPMVTVVTTQPLSGMATTGPTTQGTDLAADAFVSPIDGIEFNPPRGGIIRRVLGGSEIVGFSYPDRGWDIRVKPVVLPPQQEIKLSDTKSFGLLEITALQLTRANDSTYILAQQVFSFNDSPAGLIEARYKEGIDTVFAQEVFLRQGINSYVMVQMVSPGGLDPASKLKEAEARRIFHEVLGSFKLLDREGLRRHQDEWILNTEAWYEKLTGDQIKAAIVPVQYMRVLQSQKDPVTKETVKKDIGFMQFFERPVTQGGVAGVQLVVRSYMEHSADPKPAEPVATAAGRPGDENRVDIPTPISRATGAVMPKRPEIMSVRTECYYFMSFDRERESWTTGMLANDGSQPKVEYGNSDVFTKIKLDVGKQEEEAPIRKTNGQPPVIMVKVRKVNVSPASGGTIDPPILTFCYLPQLMGQMLPRLLPTEPRIYAFCYYVSDTRAAMFRYVEVGKPEDVVLNGVSKHAIPISDRIGVEGIPTTQYMSMDGKWLGSLNTQTGLEVLPVSPAELKTIWSGFQEYPDPEMPKEAPKGRPGTIPPSKNPILEGQ